jgi:hypothetical protein
MAERPTKEAVLTRKACIGIAVLVTLLALAQPSPAARQTGTLRGKITDNQGFPLAGAYIYVASPSLVGIDNFITSETGQFDFPNLSPGVYGITVEMPGFKTVRAEGVVLVAGATALLNFKLDPSEIEDEVITRTPDPGLDKTSARLAAVLDRDLITRIPLPRDFSAVLGLVPGVAIESDFPDLSASIHGAPVAGNAFMQDGVNVTDPVSRAPMPRINIDLIDQVVVETAGVAADRGLAQGAYVNVIRRSGSNDLGGSLGIYYTGGGLTRSLWPASEIGANNPAAPRTDRGNLDMSFTAGGPLLQDIGWFLTGLRFRARAQTTPFRNWQDPIGVPHFPYNWRDSDLSGTLKLSSRVTKQFRATVDLGFSKVSETVYEPDAQWNRPLESTRRLAGQSSFTGRAQVLYTMDQRTVADLSLGYASLRQPLLLNDRGLNKPSYYDSFTGYVWGSGAYNDQESKKRFRANVTLTHFQDKALGAAHELVGGADYETGNGSSSIWKSDNLVMEYVNGSPYAFGQAVSPVSGNSVGAGRIGFSFVPGNAAPMDITRELKRLGAFGQDTMTFGGRVSLSLGLRFDHSVAQIQAFSRGAAGNDLAVTLGTNLIKPIYGFNPFEASIVGRWESVVAWNSLSPRFGLSIDLFGTGKTLLRGTYSRLPEELGLGCIRNLDPVLVDRIHNFTWYDENGDGLADEDDTYVAFAENYTIYGTTVYQKRVDPGLRAPMMDEWSAGVDHELMPDFSLSVRYISRSEKGVIGDVMYDPDTGTPWYTVQNSPEGWWVPFSTIVPASAAYPETDVTVYFRSTSAPAPFDRVQKVPELGWKYRGLELSFRKRMSHNWQLFGSVVWSRSTGNAGLASPLTVGLASPVLTPNSFINVPTGSRTDIDRPLAIRVMGTVRLKYDILLSAFYRFSSGAAWGRTVTIIPPASWAMQFGADATPVTVFLESPGARRHGSLQTTDLRLEKEFRRGGKASWSVYLDVLNLFGDKYRIIDYNDGLWYPDREGTSEGTHLLSGTYGRAVFLSGVRTFALGLRLGF